jgi:hypothetical protein
MTAFVVPLPFQAPGLFLGLLLTKPQGSGFLFFADLPPLVYDINHE